MAINVHTGGNKDLRNTPEIEFTDNGDGTYTLQYTLLAPGPYLLSIPFDPDTMVNALGVNSSNVADVFLDAPWETGLIVEGNSAINWEEFGGWVGGLLNLNSHENRPVDGFWILPPQDYVFTVTGEFVSPNSIFNLHLGQNLIGFPIPSPASISPIDVCESFPESDQLQAILGSGDSSMNIGECSMIGSLTEMWFARGYWVAVSSDVDVNFEYLFGQGCMDQTACNYNSNATTENNSCIYIGSDPNGIGIQYVSECGCLVNADSDEFCDEWDEAYCSMYGCGDQIVDECVGLYDECGDCNGDGPDMCLDGSYECDAGDCPVPSQPCQNEYFADGTPTDYLGQPIGQGYNTNLCYSVSTMADGRNWLAQNLKQRSDSESEQYIPNHLGVPDDGTLWFDDYLEVATTGFLSEELSPENYEGIYYNFYAVRDYNICPFGWHVPTLEEWQTLIEAEQGAGSEVSDWVSIPTGTSSVNGFNVMYGGNIFAHDYDFNQYDETMDVMHEEGGGEVPWAMFLTSTPYDVSIANVSFTVRFSIFSGISIVAGLATTPYHNAYNVRCVEGDIIGDGNNEYIEAGYKLTEDHVFLGWQPFLVCFLDEDCEELIINPAEDLMAPDGVVYPIFTQAAADRLKEDIITYQVGGRTACPSVPSWYDASILQITQYPISEVGHNASGCMRSNYDGDQVVADIGCCDKAVNQWQAQGFGLPAIWGLGLNRCDVLDGFYNYHCGGCSCLYTPNGLFDNILSDLDGFNYDSLWLLPYVPGASPNQDDWPLVTAAMGPSCPQKICYSLGEYNGRYCTENGTSTSVSVAECYDDVGEHPQYQTVHGACLTGSGCSWAYKWDVGDYQDYFFAGDDYFDYSNNVFPWNIPKWNVNDKSCCPGVTPSVLNEGVTDETGTYLAGDVHQSCIGDYDKDYISDIDWGNTSQTFDFSQVPQDDDGTPAPTWFNPPESWYEHCISICDRYTDYSAMCLPGASAFESWNTMCMFQGDYSPHTPETCDGSDGTFEDSWIPDGLDDLSLSDTYLCYYPDEVDGVAGGFGVMVGGCCGWSRAHGVCVYRGCTTFRVCASQCQTQMDNDWCGNNCQIKYGREISDDTTGDSTVTTVSAGDGGLAYLDTDQDGFCDFVAGVNETPGTETGDYINCVSNTFGCMDECCDSATVNIGVTCSLVDTCGNCYGGTSNYSNSTCIDPSTGLAEDGICLENWADQGCGCAPLGAVGAPPIMFYYDLDGDGTGDENAPLNAIYCEYGGSDCVDTNGDGTCDDTYIKTSDTTGVVPPLGCGTAPGFCPSTSGTESGILAECFWNVLDCAGNCCDDDSGACDPSDNSDGNGGLHPFYNICNICVGGTWPYVAFQEGNASGITAGESIPNNSNNLGGDFSGVAGKDCSDQCTCTESVGGSIFIVNNENCSTAVYACYYDEDGDTFGVNPSTNYCNSVGSSAGTDGYQCPENYTLDGTDQYPDCDNAGALDGKDDCNEDCNGEAIIDVCGVCCGGDTAIGAEDCNTCAVAMSGDGDTICTNTPLGPDFDCNAQCFGTAFVDDCSICAGGGTGNVPNATKDCNSDCAPTDGTCSAGVCSGTCANGHFGCAEVDSCGQCAGGDTIFEYNYAIDCNGDCFGGADNDTNCLEACVGGLTQFECIQDCANQWYINDLLGATVPANVDDFCEDCIGPYGAGGLVPNAADVGCGCDAPGGVDFYKDTDGDLKPDCGGDETCGGNPSVDTYEKQVYCEYINYSYLAPDVEHHVIDPDNCGAAAHVAGFCANTNWDDWPYCYSGVIDCHGCCESNGKLNYGHPDAGDCVYDSDGDLGEGTDDCGICGGDASNACTDGSCANMDCNLDCTPDNCGQYPCDIYCTSLGDGVCVAGVCDGGSNTPCVAGADCEPDPSVGCAYMNHCYEDVDLPLPDGIGDSSEDLYLCVGGDTDYNGTGTDGSDCPSDRSSTSGDSDPTCQWNTTDCEGTCCNPAVQTGGSGAYECKHLDQCNQCRYSADYGDTADCNLICLNGCYAGTPLIDFDTAIDCVPPPVGNGGTYGSLVDACGVCWDGNAGEIESTYSSAAGNIVPGGNPPTYIFTGAYDCAYECFGGAVVGNCGLCISSFADCEYCVETEPYYTDESDQTSPYDCLGECYGLAGDDNCGVCVAAGDTSCTTDCNEDICNDNTIICAKEDACGICHSCDGFDCCTGSSCTNNPVGWNIGDLGCGCGIGVGPQDHWPDTDNDGYGNAGSATSLCADTSETIALYNGVGELISHPPLVAEAPCAGCTWVLNDSDPEPDCYNAAVDALEIDCQGICNGNAKSNACGLCVCPCTRDTVIAGTCLPDDQSTWENPDLACYATVPDENNYELSNYPAAGNIGNADFGGPLGQDCEYDCEGTKSPKACYYDLDGDGLGFGTSLYHCSGGDQTDPCDEESLGYTNYVSNANEQGSEYEDCYTNDVDCAGTCNGSAALDECGVCGGDNSSCVDVCNIPNGDGGTCCNNLCPSAGADWDYLQLPDCNWEGLLTTGSCTAEMNVDTDGCCCQNVTDCAGVCAGSAADDVCGDCDGGGLSCCDTLCGTIGPSYGHCENSPTNTGTDCLDGAYQDEVACGLATIEECTWIIDGYDFDYLQYPDCDEAGTCECDESGPMDCNDICGGDAVADICSPPVCTGGNTGKTAGATCCSNLCGSNTYPQLIDCDETGGESGANMCCDGCYCSSLQDCAGICGGSSTVDNCGLCDDDASNDCGQDCGGAYGGDGEYLECCAATYCIGTDVTGLYDFDSSVIDSCSSVPCTDCPYGPNNGSTYEELDNCDQCGGDNTYCCNNACAGELPNCDTSTGVCECTGGQDCYGICSTDVNCGSPNDPTILGCAVADVCGVCNGDGTTCCFLNDCGGEGTIYEELPNCNTTGALTTGNCGELGVGECCCVNATDCAGECGGSAVDDVCEPAVCGGDGSSCCSNGCGGNTPDCRSDASIVAGTCGDVEVGQCCCLVFDDCGNCNGSQTSGCLDSDACNYDDDASCSDSGCTYIQQGACNCDGWTNDCVGVCGGQTVDDDCGYCGGTNFYNTPGDSGTGWNCGVNNVSCDNVDCLGACDGDAVLDNCGTCDADASNDCVQDCDGQWGGSNVLDVCNVCNSDSADDGLTCCHNVVPGTNEICNSDGSDSNFECSGTAGEICCPTNRDCEDTCAPANCGVANPQSLPGCKNDDCCGECGGYGLTCCELENAGSCPGVDYCTSNANPDCDGAGNCCCSSSGGTDCGGTVDCAGNCMGAATVDNCGDCDTNNSNDCGALCPNAATAPTQENCTTATGSWENGVCYGGTNWGEYTCCDPADSTPNGDVIIYCGANGTQCGDTVDECGVCNGDNTTCADECGVPNGDNSSCADCNGTPNGDWISHSCIGGTPCLPAGADSCAAPDDSPCIATDCAGECEGGAVISDCAECGDNVCGGSCSNWDCSGSTCGTFINTWDCSGEATNTCGTGECASSSPCFAPTCTPACNDGAKVWACPADAGNAAWTCGTGCSINNPCFEPDCAGACELTSTFYTCADGECGGGCGLTASGTTCYAADCDLGCDSSHFTLTCDAGYCGAGCVANGTTCTADDCADSCEMTSTQWVCDGDTPCGAACGLTASGTTCSADDCADSCEMTSTDYTCADGECGGGCGLTASGTTCYAADCADSCEMTSTFYTCADGECGGGCGLTANGTTCSAADCDGSCDMSSIDTWVCDGTLDCGSGTCAQSSPCYESDKCGVCGGSAPSWATCCDGAGTVEDSTDCLWAVQYGAPDCINWICGCNGTVDCCDPPICGGNNDCAMTWDCSGDGDCCFESWIGDGLCDGTTQQWGCDLSCYDDDGGDCCEGLAHASGDACDPCADVTCDLWEFCNEGTCISASDCEIGYITDCDGNCNPFGWLGDGWCDGTDALYGANFCCYGCDGGDCTGNDYQGNPWCYGADAAC